MAYRDPSGRPLPEAMADNPEHPEHGTARGYSTGKCRCEPCRAAGAAKRREGLPDGDRRHGTANGYRTYGCRCDDCKAAGAAATRRQVARDRLSTEPRGKVGHGLTRYRNHGCRCEVCMEAAREARKRWPIKRYPKWAGPTRRSRNDMRNREILRLRAETDLTLREIGERFGISASAVSFVIQHYGDERHRKR